MNAKLGAICGGWSSFLPHGAAISASRRASLEGEATESKDIAAPRTAIAAIPRLHKATDGLSQNGYGVKPMVLAIFLKT